MSKDKSKRDAVGEVLAKVTGKEVPYQRVRVSDCVPNDWNMNKMSEGVKAKLSKGLHMLWDNGLPAPPIVVRPHPNPSMGKYQIIDGEQRWTIARDEERKRIDAYVIDCDNKTAMILTDTLNYLRGDPDPDAQVLYYKRLMTENAMTTTAVSEYLPVTSDEVQQTLDAYDIHVDIIEVPEDTESKPSDDDGDNQFIEVKFLLARSQQEVVERELARIGSLLKGKNVRGRALEFMAVNSSTTPIDNIMGEGEGEAPPKDEEEKPAFKPKTSLKKVKSKLKERAA